MNTIKENFDVIVIGGGASGMIAAGRAAELGAKVLLLEKNNSLGVKLRLTGNGRCNITNISAGDDLKSQYGSSGRFLHNAFSVFCHEELREFFKRLGVDTKTAEKGRVFPVSEKSSDVINSLDRYLRENKVEIRFVCRAEEIIVNNNKAMAVRTSADENISAGAVILAAGGKSYPQTGSTGDGYVLAQKCGHRIMPLRPGLTALEAKEEWVKNLQGISLADARVEVCLDNKKLKQAQGEMLFTHFGLSGPMILDLSLIVADNINKGNILLKADCLPGVSAEELSQELNAEQQNTPQRPCKNILTGRLQRRLLEQCLSLAGIRPEKKTGLLSKDDKLSLIRNIKCLQLTVSNTRPFAEAMITQGGADTAEIHPKTMESKIVNGLYLCGEVLDIAGITGGYNLQAAFSTGYLAGESAAMKTQDARHKTQDKL